MPHPKEDAAPPVTPALIAALVSDCAIQDPSTGKWSLIGIFTNINASRFPTTRPLSVYFKLADAEGTYKLRIEHVRVATDEVLARAEGQVTIKDRTSYTDIALPLPPLPFPEAGGYELRIWANNTYLGCAHILGKPRT